MPDTRERLSTARTTLILDSPFFGALALRLRFIEDAAAAMGTMATDGRAIYYNPEYVATLADNQLVGVLAHEVLHPAMQHHTRRNNRDLRRWNVACDYAINPVLKDAGFTLPADVLLDASLRGQSAEQIYASLPSNDDDNSNGNDDGNLPGGGVLDAPDPTGDEAEWQVAVAQAAQAAKMMGRLPGAVARMVKEALAPKVDWKAVLRRFVQQCATADYSWRMPNRRYSAMGLYLPALRSESMPPIVVAIDTSGSIGEAELSAFRAEVSSIIDECQPEATHVVYCDCTVERMDTIERGEPLGELRTETGGGGTDFCPVFNHVAEQEITPTCLIYLTDGQGTYPDEAPEYPVLWAMTTEYTAPWGEQVRLTA